ncbi:hypothetical protein EDD15DRAFT_2291001 [Pisolithus albus]|nr:hypothetical protein EDD15DRAFT_2291001 [Pisolithus albus]
MMLILTLQSLSGGYLAIIPCFRHSFILRRVQRWISQPPYQRVQRALLLHCFLVRGGWTEATSEAATGTSVSFPMSTP